MNAELALAGTDVALSRPTTSFSLCCPQEGALYHQLLLEDEHGSIATWVIPASLKQVSKHPMLLWRLATPASAQALTCVESGAIRPAAVSSGALPDLRAELAQGLLRLHFGGHLLRGYHRLHCLPEGDGQLWQLVPLNA